MRAPLNHLHLHVRDIAASADFYKTHLGMTETVNFGGLVFLSDGSGFDLALMADDAPSSMPAWFHFGSRLASRQAVAGYCIVFLDILQQPGEPLTRPHLPQLY